LKLNNFNMIDSGSYGTFVAPCDELFNASVFRFSNYFNPAIWEVFGVPFYGKMLSLVLGKKAKVNALNSTRNQNFNSTSHS